MLAIVLSMIFGVAAFGALAVIHASTVTGVLRARQIRDELRGSQPRRALNPAAARPGVRRAAWHHAAA